MDITKPAITRLARRAGVKSLTDDCYTTINKEIGKCISDILNVTIIINSSRSVKTLMEEDLNNAFRLKGLNIAQSSDINTKNCVKNLR